LKLLLWERFFVSGLASRPVHVLLFQRMDENTAGPNNTLNISLKIGLKGRPES
jgi:hypothetical protein